MRTWLDDLAHWLPTQQSDYATLVEHGFIITSQGKVATYDLDHALAIRSRLQQLYTFDNPSPCVPNFGFGTAGAPQTGAGAIGPQTRSQAATGSSAAPAAAPPPTSVPLSTSSVANQRPPLLTPDESN
eukprot:2099118-Pleurochrysis_carterae.AAC.1